MSAPRCGYCSAPTLNGTLCRDDWGRLRDLLHRCDGIDADLASAVGRRGRHGEVVSRSSAPGLPINVDAADARRDLIDTLNGALGALFGPFPRLTAGSAAALLLTHSRRVLGSHVGPSLLGDLGDAVPRAVAMTDKPRGRMTVSVPCPRCGEGPLRPLMGALECTSCRERMSIGEVRGA